MDAATLQAMVDERVIALLREFAEGMQEEIDASMPEIPTLTEVIDPGP